MPAHNHFEWEGASDHFDRHAERGVNMPKGVGELLLSLAALLPNVQSDSGNECDGNSVTGPSVGMAPPAARPVLHPPPPPL